MAKLAVDRLVERDAREAPCRTQEIPLGQQVDRSELERVEGVPAESYAALAGRYGYAAHEVLRTAGERGELAQPIVPGLPDLLAEASHAARREQARSVADVLLRRTRLGLLAARGSGRQGRWRPSARAARGRELGWDEERTSAEVDRFAQVAQAEGLVAAAP